MKKLLFMMLFINYTNSFAQHDNFDEIIPPQGFGIKLLNSAGNSSLNNFVSNLSYMNPASISNLANYSFGISYQYNTNIENGWINNSEVSRENDLIPQSAGVVIKWKQLTFGIGFGQSYNSKVDFIWNFYSPEEQQITEFKGRVSSYTSAISFTLNDIFKSSNFNVGLSYTFNRVNYSSSNQFEEVNLNDNAGNFSIGVQYSNKNQSEKNTKVGLSYTTAATFEHYIHNSSGFTIIVRDNKPLKSKAYETLVKANIPDQFNADLSTYLSDKLNLNISLAGVFWKQSDNNLEDQIEFSASTVYEINKMFSPAFGFYYTDKNYEQDIFNLNDKFNALFLIAGLKFNCDIFSADLAIADSHLFSGDFRKQTIGKLAIGVQL
jgi:hypothetical protein